MRRGERVPQRRGPRARDSSTGPLPRGPRSGYVGVVLPRPRRSPGCRSLTPREGPATARADPAGRCVHAPDRVPSRVALLLALAACRDRPAPGRRRARAGSHDHHRHAQRGDRQDAGGPELPARPPPPHGRADARCRAARASTSRARSSASASPVIATGLRRAARPARAIVEQLTEESILNDFVRIREESRTNTAVLDPTTGEQTEINERGPAVTEQRGRAVLRQAALPRPGRADVRVRGLAAARRRPRHLRAPDPRAAQARRHDRASTPTASRCATPCAPSRDVISPNVLEAEELVGHEFNDDEDRVIAVREMVELGAREAIMTAARRLLRAWSLEDGRAAALPRRGWSRCEPRATRRLGRRLPGRLRGGALRRREPGRVPALRRRLRRRVDPAPRARACSTRAQVERLRIEIERASGSSSRRRSGRSASCGRVDRAGRHRVRCYRSLPRPPRA